MLLIEVGHGEGEIVRVDDVLPVVSWRPVISSREQRKSRNMPSLTEAQLEILGTTEPGELWAIISM